MDINEKKLSSVLAHNATEDEMFGDEKITNTDQMWVTCNTEKHKYYTEEAQKIYDRYYNYFNEMILECKINNNKK